MFANSKFFSVLAVLAAGAGIANAHGHVKTWVVGGENKPGYNPSNSNDYGGVTAQRPADNADQGFVPDITSGRVACGGASAGSGLETWPVQAGSTVTAIWDTWPESHKGPIIEYMAACPASGCDGVDAASLSWFKISESSYNGIWAGETLSQTKQWDINIPASIASGPYLIRHEVIAMHSTGSPQVYPYCIQADVQGGGSVSPAGVNIIDAYNTNPDFQTWNLYDGSDQSTFVAPGPPVFDGAGGGAPAPAPSSSAPVPSSSASALPSSAPGPSSSAPALPSSAPNPSASVPAEEPVPAPSASTPVEGTYPTEPEQPPVETSAPVPSSSAAAPQPSSQSSAAAPAPTGGNPSNAQYCMNEMNLCKNRANKLPNAEVGPAFEACDAAVAQCFTSAARKRDVINRYARRSLRVL